MKFNEDNTKTWEDGTEPTPEQWSNWFVMLPNDYKLKVAEDLIVRFREMNTCFLMNHIGQIEYQTELMEVGRWLLKEQEWEFKKRVEFIEIIYNGRVQQMEEEYKEYRDELLRLIELSKWLLAEADWERCLWAVENSLGNSPQRLWERIQHNREHHSQLHASTYDQD